MVGWRQLSLKLPVLRSWLVVPSLKSTGRVQLKIAARLQSTHRLMEQEAGARVVHMRVCVFIYLFITLHQMYH